MDRVRLGRVLGKGARLAARTAIEAVAAATATSPQASAQRGPTVLTPERPPIRPAGRRPIPPDLRSAVLPAARAAGKGLLAPLGRASRELWHELTGSFFALFAFSFGAGAWHMRGHAASPVPDERYRFFAVCALALLFLYFAVSSFLRARERAAR